MTTEPKALPLSDAVKFLNDAADNFARIAVNTSEDMTHWAHRQNAENCRAVIETLITAQRAREEAEGKCVAIIEAADPFKRMYEINKPLIEQRHLEDGLRDWTPGVWPTLGDLKKLRDLVVSPPAAVTAHIERVKGLEAELEAARAALKTRYVSGDVIKMVDAALKEISTQAETICRLRGETDAHADLKRFVNYVDHTTHMSPGEVSSIIDFAQGQMTRALQAEAERDAALKEKRTPGTKEVCDLYQEPDCKWLMSNNGADAPKCRHVYCPLKEPRT